MSPTPWVVEDLTWDGVIQRFSTSIEITDKLKQGGFGAHELKPGATRCASGVTQVSAFVFDVDKCRDADVGVCEMNLRSANQAALFYSSFSHRADSPAFRLIIPPTRSVTPAEYPSLRRYLIERYRIPGLHYQTQDASRFWFAPSHPPGATPLLEVLPGDPFDVDAAAPFASRIPPPHPRARRGPDDEPPTTVTVPFGEEWTPPPETGGAVDLTPLREALRARASKLVSKHDLDSKTKGDLLRKLLAGEPLAEAGSRNDAMLRACGLMVYAVPHFRTVPLSHFMLLLRPSLTAMVNAGSKLNEDKVQRMLETALRKRAESSIDVEEFRRVLTERKAAFMQSLRAKAQKDNQ